MARYSSTSTSERWRVCEGRQGALESGRGWDPDKTYKLVDGVQGFKVVVQDILMGLTISPRWWASIRGYVMAAKCKVTSNRDCLRKEEILDRV